MALTLRKGYSWGPLLTKPSKLSLSQILNHGNLEPGLYDVATVPFGDNWAIPDVSLCKYTTVKIQSICNISILPVFDVDEPSCGFLFCLRGPYIEGTPEADRGDWSMTYPPDGEDFKRTSVPVYTHIGARKHRFIMNGYPWKGKSTYPHISSTYWEKNPVGSKSINGLEREKIEPSKYGPDVTIYSNLKAGKIFVAISKVDMFGRETVLSDAVEIDLAWNGSYAKLINFSPNQIGCCGFYLYAGYSTSDMHRQPILDCEGASPKYIWPPQAKQFYIHKVIETGIRAVPPPSYGIASIIPEPLARVWKGEKYIDFKEFSYDLYCPFLLPYDVQNFGRKLGTNGRLCTFTQKANYGDAKLITDYPLMIIESQRDEISNCVFISDYSTRGVTFNDYSGGQAFSDSLINCGFELYAPDSIAFSVEDTSCVGNGFHSASEIRIKNCVFAATIPVLVEGNQTCKIRFTEMCEFYGSGNTKYKADTVGLGYICSPNQFGFHNICGINGSFRSIVATSCLDGLPIVIIEDIFLDYGCNVYVTVGTSNGARVEFIGGERINTRQKWVRLVEAPIVCNTEIKFDGVLVDGRTSSITFMLNQLALDLDFPVGEVVSPTEAFWESKGLVKQYPNAEDVNNGAYRNFMLKPRKGYVFGYLNLIDTLPQIVVNTTEP